MNVLLNFPNLLAQVRQFLVCYFDLVINAIAFFLLLIELAVQFINGFQNRPMLLFDPFGFLLGFGNFLIEFFQPQPFLTDFILDG